jgi:hypothetical protein
LKACIIFDPHLKEKRVITKWEQNTAMQKGKYEGDIEAVAIAK